MKHDQWLRQTAERSYCDHYLEPDADFAKAERTRSPEYLAAVELAFAMRISGRDFEKKLRQLPLL